jgi:hypothetical protein
MDYQIQYLSFFVIQVEGKGEQADKRYKHFQTMNEQEYDDSSLKEFLDGEFAKIVKRKVERHPKADEVPTKIGYFVVEEGHDLTSNPNYNLFNRTRCAESKEDFHEQGENFVNTYLNTSAVRGRALKKSSCNIL